MNWEVFQRQLLVTRSCRYLKREVIRTMVYFRLDLGIYLGNFKGKEYFKIEDFLQAKMYKFCIFCNVEPKGSKSQHHESLDNKLVQTDFCQHKTILFHSKKYSPLTV